MATHRKYEDIDQAHPSSHVNDPHLNDQTLKAERLLHSVPSLQVLKMQYKRQGILDNAWYVGLPSKPDLFLLNFKITPSDVNVEFRFSQYLREAIFEQLQLQNSSWRYASLNKFGEDEVKGFIDTYLEDITADCIIRGAEADCRVL